MLQSQRLQNEGSKGTLQPQQIVGSYQRNYFQEQVLLYDHVIQHEGYILENKAYEHSIASLDMLTIHYHNYALLSFI